jgi:ethanolamine ammonia-lyase small subunit
VSPSETSIELPDLIRVIRTRTPARIFSGRAGSAYRTQTQLELRQDHAAASDAVHAELDLAQDFEEKFVRRWGLFQVCSSAKSKNEFLLRPDLGRRLRAQARESLLQNCPAGADFQIFVGDGLSALAVLTQVPALLPLLAKGAEQRQWVFGRPFLVRYCRVGILNEVGELLKPQVAVLLIGERPGLATAESLSAYMAYQPRSGHTDAERNLISNIHSRGTPRDLAAYRILALAEQMMQMKASGVAVKEELRYPSALSESSPAKIAPPEVPGC